MGVESWQDTFSFHGRLSDHFKWNVNWCFLLGSASLILEEGLYSGWKLWSSRAVPTMLSLSEKQESGASDGLLWSCD